MLKLSWYRARTFFLQKAILVNCIIKPSIFSYASSINMNKTRQIQQIESLCTFRDTIDIHGKYFSADAEVDQRLKEMWNRGRPTVFSNINANCWSLFGIISHIWENMWDWKLILKSSTPTNRTLDWINRVQVKYISKANVIDSAQFTRTKLLDTSARLKC